MEEEEFWEVPAFLTKPEILEQMDLSKVQVPHIDLRPDYWIWVKEILENTLKGHEVCAFGSRAKWTNQEGSDLDLVVMDAVSSEEICAAKSAFQDSLLPIKVDIGQWHSMSEDFQNRIKKDLITLTSKKNTLPEGWRKVTLGDASIINPKTPPIPEEFIYIDLSSVKNGELLEKKFTKKLGAPSRAQRLLQDKDILFQTVRPYQKNNLFFKSNTLLPAYVASTGYAILRSKTNQTFLYYLIHSKTFVRQAVGFCTGTNYPAITPSNLANIEILLPPLHEQEAIAGVLSALDDKIAHNKAQNKLLEEMAQALFKDWFVYFGPTREKIAAKKENRPEKPYLEPEIWNLFPDTLTPDGIPEGWEEKPLKDIANITMGQSPPGSSYNEKQIGMPFYQGTAEFSSLFPKRRLFTTAPSRMAYPENALVSVRAPVGDVNMAEEECCIGRGLSAVSHKEKLPFFTWLLMKNLKEQFLTFDGEGTVFGSINKSSFENLTILNNGLECYFEKLATPIFKKIKANEQENKKLAEMRDALLPQLISGKLRMRL